jgi:hypothetical protein
MLLRSLYFHIPCLLFFFAQLLFYLGWKSKCPNFCFSFFLFIHIMLKPYLETIKTVDFSITQSNTNSIGLWSTFQIVSFIYGVGMFVYSNCVEIWTVQTVLILLLKQSVVVGLHLDWVEMDTWTVYDMKQISFVAPFFSFSFLFSDPLLFDFLLKFQKCFTLQCFFSIKGWTASRLRYYNGLYRPFLFWLL